MAVVLLTDGDERSTLAACRSLVRAGHEVHVLAARRRSLAGVSRHVREHVVSSNPFTASAAFVAAVAVLARDVAAHVLIPMTDASATAILSRRGELPAACRVPFDSLESFQRASDKAALLPVAESAGFAVPTSVLIESADAADRVDLRAFAPGVLKPHRSVVPIGAELRRQGVVRFDTVEEGQQLLQALPDAAFPVLAQRRVQGPGVGFFALRWRGTTIAKFAHRRVREIPPTGGVSVCRESIALPAALANAGMRLLEALDWQGVAMVECKYDPVTDRYYVIEINPRFWGSLQLAIDAGVDFPALLVECALGRVPVPVTHYRTGVRSRWGWGEIDYIYLRAKLRENGESAAGAALRAAWDVARWKPGRDRGEILRLRDPRPFVVETLRRFGLFR